MHEQQNTISISKKTLIPLGSLGIIVAVVVYVVNVANAQKNNERDLEEIKKTYVTERILDLKLGPIYQALNIKTSIPQ